eukprot:TRINITY_DN1411_c0_g1_i4.p1 TRINITY_DN1411_c0_g1~~TRINITY_DN1411_c0_g1_i4.p1  ORF type:complete len:511 (-),score=75.27 TRINITY_DN1411_c0_g1_i4:514-1989(-)
MKAFLFLGLTAIACSFFASLTDGQCIGNPSACMNACCNRTLDQCVCFPGYSGTNCMVTADTFAETFDTVSSVNGAPAENTTVAGAVRNVFRASHATVSNNVLTLLIDDVGCPAACTGLGNTGAEWVSSKSFPAGRFSFRAKAGTCNNCYLGLGLATPTNGFPSDEIALFIHGSTPTQILPAIFATGNDQPYMATRNLGFDASQDFHLYEIVWVSGTSVEWWVDGQLVASSTPTQHIPTKPMKVIVEWFVPLGAAGAVGTGTAQCAGVNVTAVPGSCAAFGTVTTAASAGSTSTAAPASTTSTGTPAASTTTSTGGGVVSSGTTAPASTTGTTAPASTTSGTTAPASATTGTSGAPAGTTSGTSAAPTGSTGIDVSSTTTSAAVGTTGARQVAVRTRMWAADANATVASEACLTPATDITATIPEGICFRHPAVNFSGPVGAIAQFTGDSSVSITLYIGSTECLGMVRLKVYVCVCLGRSAGMLPGRGVPSG